MPRHGILAIQHFLSFSKTVSLEINNGQMTDTVEQPRVSDTLRDERHVSGSRGIRVVGGVPSVPNGMNQRGLHHIGEPQESRRRFLLLLCRP